MKKYILTYFFSLTLSIAFGQTAAPEEYSVLVKRADSLYRAKDYKNSAFAYSSAFKTFGWKGYQNDRYNAACSWALAGFTDSAFFNLERIASKTNFSDYRNLTTDNDLMSLHNDNRWKPLLQLVLENKEKSEAGFNKPLLHLLDSLVDEDQKWRTYSTRYENGELKGKADTISMALIFKNAVITDSLNYCQIQDIYKKYGFPNYDLVGQEGSNNFWLLVQHQDNHPDFQESVLEKMKIEVDAKKASPANYAYLTDRVKVNSGKLQVYGTQMKLNADATSYEPKPMIDPKQVDERRKSVGLETIENYIEVMNNRYRGTLKKR